MTTNIVAGGGFKFSIQSIGGMWSWLVAIDNIPNAGQRTQVKDIQSPFGSFVRANIPLPGDVILAMADSLSDFQQQLAPRVLLISPASFAFTVTEGDPIVDATTIIFQNIGALGSYMNEYSIPDVPWLSSNPPNVIGIGKNQQGQTDIQIIPASMLASSSPYTGHINIQDNANPPNIVPATFNVTVLPRPTVGLSIDHIDLIYYMSTHSPGGPQEIVVTNTGPSGSILNFNLTRVLNQSAWLNIVPTSGGPLTSGTDVHVVFSVNSSCIPSLPGVYSDTIRINSVNATNTPIDIPVSIAIVP
jgi:hypothetical protein